MKLKTTLFSLLGFLTLSSTAWGQQMMATRPSPKKYSSIAQLEATKKSPEKAYEELKKSAQKLSADAVIGIRCVKQEKTESGSDSAAEAGDRLNQAGTKTKELSGNLADTTSKLGGTASKVGQIGKAAEGIGSAVKTASSIISIFKGNKPKIICTGEAVQWVTARK